MCIYMVFLAVFWTIYTPFIAYDQYAVLTGFGLTGWPAFLAGTCFFCVLCNAMGMLGHAAKYSVSLRAIPMILLRIACLSGILGLIGNYIFACNTWWDYYPNYGWMWVFYIWLTTSLNMLPLVAIAWIALRPPHSNHLHAVVVETQQPVVYQQ